MSLRLTGNYTVELCKNLNVKFRIPYKDQHSIIFCYRMSKRHPEQFEMTVTVGGIGNKTDFVKVQVVAWLTDF